jgi:hypothetical protein
MQLSQLLTLEEAIASMAQEGTRVKQIEKVEVVPKPAHYMLNRQEADARYDCGVNGHLS